MSGARHHGRTLRSAVLGALLAPALLAGCTTVAGDDPVEPTPPTGAPSSGPTTEAPATEPTDDDDAAAATSTSLAVGPVALEVSTPAGTPAPVLTPGDESTTELALVVTPDLVVTLDDGPDAPATPTPVETRSSAAASIPAASITATGGSLVRHADGSLGVLDDAGTAVGGLTAPEVVGAGTRPGGGSTPPVETDAQAPTARFDVVDDHRATVTLTAATPAPSGSDDAATHDVATTYDVVTTLGTQGLRSATWGEREGGRSLAVDATAWARTAGRTGQELVLAELAATEPEARSATMHDQLVCHAVGAPDKETWNLEPWRPDVGLLATMAARCNPT